MNLKNKYTNFKIAWYQDKLKSFVFNEVTAPIYVRVKPTNRCCHKCIWCVYEEKNSNMHTGMSRSDELPLPKLLEILGDFSDIGVKAVTYSGGGEPLVYPGINEVFETTLDKNIALSLITNGQLLRGKSADLLKNSKWVRVSMDYYDEASFTGVRGVGAQQFHTICSNVETFSTSKSKECNLTSNWIISRDNYKKIIEASRMMKNIGIELVRFSPLWVKDFYRYHDPIKAEVKEILAEARNLETDGFKIVDGYNTDIAVARSVPKCYYNQVVPVVGADGNVYTCHNKAYDPDGAIGSVKTQSFKQLWFSGETKKFFDGFQPIKTCKNQCANEQKNQFIQGMVDCYGDVFP